MHFLSVLLRCAGLQDSARPVCSAFLFSHVSVQFARFVSGKLFSSLVLIYVNVELHGLCPCSVTHKGMRRQTEELPQYISGYSANRKQWLPSKTSVTVLSILNQDMWSLQIDFQINCYLELSG